jgi:hypothetical protein
MARPHKIGPAEKEKILKWIEEGLCSRAKCAERLRINEDTLQREMVRDPEFKKAVEDKENEMHDSIVSALMRHARTKDYRACMAILQQKWRKDWGRQNDYTTQEVLQLALQFSELIKEFVPEDQQVGFANKVEQIIKDMETAKKAASREFDK